MANETIPELNGELAALFAHGRQICDSAPYPDTIVISHGDKAYLFKDWGYRGYRSGAESVFSEDSGVSFDLIASSRGFHEAREEGPFQSASDASYYETVPHLYELHSSLDLAGVLNVAKKDHFLDICLLVTDGNPRPQVFSMEHFPSWWRNPSRDFFNQRLLLSGRYFCNSIRQVALDLVARPEDYGNLDISAIETYDQNSLLFDANLGAFVMELKVTQKLEDSPRELVTALSRIQQFLFKDLDGFLERQNYETFVEYFSNSLSLMDHPELRKRLEEDFFDPFVDDDDRFASESRWWFTPQAIRFRVEKLELDPSFGTVSVEARNKFELLELRENWQKTNFENINVNAYLKRLVEQSKQFPAEK
jgi:hypothetical protein